MLEENHREMVRQGKQDAWNTHPALGTTGLGWGKQLHSEWGPGLGLPEQEASNLGAQRGT